MARLDHVGDNYPCVRDPNKPPFLATNTSYATMDGYSSIEIGFDQLANWGKWLIFKTSRLYNFMAGKIGFIYFERFLNVVLEMAFQEIKIFEILQ